MKKAGFTILWMLGSFLVGCTLLLGLAIVVNFTRAAQGDTSPPPNNRFVNLLIVYSLPALALVLGVKGVLPGTKIEKSTSKKSNASPNLAPPIIYTPATRPALPPVIPWQETGASKLSRDQIAAVLETVIQQKFGQDRSLLSPELFEALLCCIADKRTFNFIAAQSGRPSEQVVAEFEQTVGFSLPRDYRAFAMSGFGCLFIEVNESVWPRPKEGAIVPAWHLGYTLYVYGLSADVPVYMDIRKQFGVFSKGGHRIVPFLRREGSLDHHCFSPEGSIVLWHSATRTTEPVDLTFTALLLKEIRTLQERAQRIQNEPNPYA